MKCHYYKPFAVQLVSVMLLSAVMPFCLRDSSLLALYHVLVVMSREMLSWQLLTLWTAIARSEKLTLNNNWSIITCDLWERNNQLHKNHVPSQLYWACCDGQLLIVLVVSCSVYFLFDSNVFESWCKLHSGFSRTQPRSCWICSGSHERPCSISVWLIARPSKAEAGNRDQRKVHFSAEGSRWYHGRRRVRERSIPPNNSVNSSRL